MSNFPDMVTQFGGVPVGGGRYEAMWGNKVWFVDYDNGRTGKAGLKPVSAGKHLDTAISAASAWDVIYLRPRTPDTSGGDPQHHLPSSTSNYSIASTKHGLSIIGTGFGAGKEKANMTRIQGASGAAASVLTVYAPFVNIENITFKRGSSTAAALLIEGQTSGGSGYAFGTSVNNCAFWKVGATATKGAVYIESAWHTTIANSWFEQCALGIGIGVSGSNTDCTSILGNVFSGLDTTIDADIWTTGGSTITEVFIDGCRFAHDIPALSAGGIKKYIYFATADGTFSNSVIGSETTTIATNCTLSNVDPVNINYSQATNFPA